MIASQSLQEAFEVAKEYSSIFFRPTKNYAVTAHIGQCTSCGLWLRYLDLAQQIGHKPTGYSFKIWPKVLIPLLELHSIIDLSLQIVAKEELVELCLAKVKLLSKEKARLSEYISLLHVIRTI